MRMWMISPRLMCNKHLLGEHGELHKFLHNWEKKHSIAGRVAGNAIEPLAYKVRHDALAFEMTARGMNHKSPLAQPNFDYLPLEHLFATVNVEQSLLLLHDRCEACRERIRKDAGFLTQEPKA